jgi:hypothetical protein
MTKSLLSKLKLTEASVKTTDPLVQRQNKLIAKLEVQREIAQCLIENEEFKAYQYKNIIDPTTGTKNKVRVEKQIKPWFYQNDGQYFTLIKYGSKSLSLNPKGLQAIAVGDKSALSSVYDTLIAATRAGEFDNELLKIRRVGNK